MRWLSDNRCSALIPAAFHYVSALIAAASLPLFPQFNVRASKGQNDVGFHSGERGMEQGNIILASPGNGILRVRKYVGFDEAVTQAE